MQGHMKKPHTEAISITFIGPVAMAAQALEAMHSLGFEDTEQATVTHQAESSIAWRETKHFKEIETKLPIVFLSGARYREGLTQEQLSERTGIPRRHISEMENGKRTIGKSNAKKLAEALNIEPRLLLSV